MYDDQIVEPKKDFIDGVGSSSVGVLFDDTRAYFDKLFGNIMADNQIREDQIMG